MKLPHLCLTKKLRKQLIQLNEGMRKTLLKWQHLEFKSTLFRPNICFSPTWKSRKECQRKDSKSSGRVSEEEICIVSAGLLLQIPSKDKTKLGSQTSMHFTFINCVIEAIDPLSIASQNALKRTWIEIKANRTEANVPI